MYFTQRTVIISILVVYAKCQSVNDLDLDKAKGILEKNNIDIPQIDLNETSLPKTEDVEKILKEKCEKNGAPDTVELMKEEQENARLCLESYVNITVLQEELDEGKLTGSMDEVFAKYCRKWPEIYACLDNSTELARTCMDKKEEDTFNRTLVILNDLQEFMCFKDGDRLAMFVAEGGVECISDRKVGIQDCLNQTIGSRLPDTDELSVTNLPIMVFTDQNCNDFDAIRECINKELEQCKESTPANIVDAFFKFLKKQLPCQGVKAAAVQQKSNSAGAISSSLLFMIFSFLYVTSY